MRRETQNVLLLLLGGALLKIVLTGHYLRYVKPSMLPWLALTGAVMVALAVTAVIGDIRSARSGGEPDRHPCEEAQGGHEHSSRSPWLLLLPVLAVFLVAPPPLGADSVQRAGPRRVERPETRFDALPPGPSPLLSVSEFRIRAIWDESGSLNGRAVRLRGFVVHREDGGARLARMRISCCAADAAPVRVDLAGRPAARAARLADNTWIEITARLRPGTATERNGYVPTVEVRALRTIPVPARPYEY